MANYAVVESDTVTNIINWDGSSDHANSSNFVADDGSAWIGATWDGSSFSTKPDTRTDADALASMRAERDSLIAETDFYALSDVTMSSDMATYRQALRDLPSGKTTKAQVDGATWPTKPQRINYGTN